MDSLEHKFRYEKCHYKGGSEIIGNATGGLIGETSAEKEAKRQKEEAERRAREMKEQQANEDKFNKEVTQDTETITNQQGNKTGKPTTTVDFSQSLAGYKEETDEDKLRKAFRRR